MSELARTITRWRELTRCTPDGEVCEITVGELTRLLDAAETLAETLALVLLRDERDAARLAADVVRDAALEEAAKVAEAVDPEKPANWLHARHKIAFAIRALKGAA